MTANICVPGAETKCNPDGFCIKVNVMITISGVKCQVSEKIAVKKIPPFIAAFSRI
jgi:hypothetical protein